MKQETLIRKAVDSAREKGIKLTRGSATLAWEGDNLVSVNITGALLVYLGLYRLPSQGGSFVPNWLPQFCAALDVDTFWLWRFWMGTDRDYQVQIWVEDKKDWEDDSVSFWARRLVRQLRVN